MALVEAIMGAVQRRGLEPDQEQIAKSRFLEDFRAPANTATRSGAEAYGAITSAATHLPLRDRPLAGLWPGRGHGSFDTRGEIGRDGLLSIFSSMVGAPEYGGA